MFFRNHSSGAALGQDVRCWWPREASVHRAGQAQDDSQSVRENADHPRARFSALHRCETARRPFVLPPAKLLPTALLQVLRRTSWRKNAPGCGWFLPIRFAGWYVRSLYFAVPAYFPPGTGLLLWRCCWNESAKASIQAKLTSTATAVILRRSRNRRAPRQRPVPGSVVAALAERLKAPPSPLRQIASGQKAWAGNELPLSARRPS